MGEGDGEVRAALPLPRRGRGLLARRGAALLLAGAGGLRGGNRLNAGYGVVAAAAGRAGRREPRRGAARADHGAADRDQRVRRVRHAEGLPAERAHGRPEPPRDRAGRPLLVLTPIYLRLERGHRLPCRSPHASPSRSSSAGDALAQRLLGLACGALVLPIPYRRHLRPRASSSRLRRRRVSSRSWSRGSTSSDGARARMTRAAAGLAALRGLRLRPGRARVESAARARTQQLLRLLRVRHRPDELRTALLLRRHDRGDRHRRRGAVRRSSAVHGAAPRGDGPTPSRRGRPLQRPRAAARRGASPRRWSGRSWRTLLPDDDLLLLLRLRPARGALPVALGRARRE